MSSPDLDAAVRALIDDEADRARRDVPSLDSFIAAASTRQRRRRHAALGAVLGAAVVAGGVGLTVRGGDQPAVVNVASSPSSSFQSAGADLPAHPRPDQVADHLAETLNGQGRNGGATWISEKKTLNVYVSGPADGKDAAVEKTQALGDELTSAVDFIVTVHAGGLRSEAQLVSTMEAVADTKSYDPSGTVKVRSEVINYEAGKVAVDVTSQAAADIVEKKFGDAVEVQVKAPYTQEEIEEMFGVLYKKGTPDHDF
ncbi:hypothetical protein M3697_16515 [Janibacter melonis]|uniref:hypothetical protein n=1 Tax=Janibacter melonis TaxID=262209 RepID=UPI0020437800|nr:hypothetical protein [Janibacter melonis]MCM3556691.1 hypothetical protein [Janibacter melonis]